MAKTKTKAKTKVSTKTLVAVAASAVVLASAAAGFASLNGRFNPSYFSNTAGYQPQGYQPNPNPTPGYQPNPNPTPGYMPAPQTKVRSGSSIFKRIFRGRSSINRYRP